MKMLKKLVAVLFAALLFGGPLAPFAAMAQGQRQTQNLYGVGGVPQENLNSLGSQWGQLFSPAANSWSYGYSSSGTGGIPPTTTGTAAFTWDNTPAFTANVPLVLAKTQVGTGQSAALGVYASTSIPVSSSYETVIASATAITLTSTPSISTMNAAGLPLASGTYLVLSSTAASNTITFTDEGTLTGSKLQLGSSTRAVTQYKTLTLIFDATDGFWRELSYGSN